MDDAHAPTIGDTLRDVGKLALPFALLGGILGAAYKVGTVLVHTPPRAQPAPKLAPYDAIRRSGTFTEIFKEFEVYCTINPKWEDLMMRKINFLLQAEGTFATMVRVAENLMAKIDELGSSSTTQGQQAPDEEAEVDAEEMVTRANARFEAAVLTGGGRRRKRTASPKTRQLFEAVQQMRAMVGDGNVLLEEVIFVKREVSDMCNEFYAILQCFNSYWHQCNQVLLADPAVYLAKSVNRADGALVMSDANVEVATDLIQKKAMLMSIVYDEGRLPSDEQYDEQMGPYIRWWTMMYCILLPTMHGTAYERGWKEFARDAQPSAESGQTFRVSRKRKERAPTTTRRSSIAPAPTAATRSASSSGSSASRARA